MTNPMRRGTYAPAARGTFTWWWARFVTRPFFVGSVVRRDARGRTREELVEVGIETALGATPDPEQRRDLLHLLAYSGVICAFVAGAVGVLAGLLVGRFADAAVASAVMRVFGVVLAAPLLGLSLVWSVRAFLNDRDYNAHRQRELLPRSRTQPNDWDLLLAAPVAIALAFFFVLV